MVENDEEVNKENMQLWVSALRSGEFLQGKNLLASQDRHGNIRHCCLGVACVVAMRNGVNVIVEVSPTTGIVSYDGEETELPLSVANFFGLTLVNPLISDPNDDDDIGTEATLANDNLSRTFEHIATGIEDYYNL